MTFLDRPHPDLVQFAGVSRQSVYRADIDGLRAIAVTSVVFFHAGLTVLRSGFVGVDVFFVISGYLIGGIILRQVAAGRFSYAGFYARRARRILPALFAVVAFTVAAGALLLSGAEFYRLGGTSLSALLAVSNISFWRYTDYFDHNSQFWPMLMTWSLGVEEQFYFIFPLVLIGLMRVARRHIFPVLGGLTLAFFAFASWRSAVDPMGAFYLLPARAWELLIGATIAAAPVRGGGPRTAGAAGFGGAALLLLGLLGPWAETAPGLEVALGVAGTAALIWARGSAVNRALGWRPLVFVGLVSYSWYLWHWPVMSLARLCATAEPSTGVMCVIAAGTFVVAVLSWRFIEQPFRHGRARPGRTLLRYGAALGVMVVAVGSVKLLHGMPQRLGPQVAAIDQVVAMGRGDCLQSFTATTVNLTQACYHPIPGRPGVALLGDSHAGALGPGLQALAQAENWGVVVAAKSSCRPLPSVEQTVPGFPGYGATCEAFLADASRRIVADGGINTVIITGLFNDLPVRSVSAAADSMRALAERFRRAGKQVIIAGDVPYWRLQPVHAAFADAIPLRHALATLLWTGGPYPSPEDTMLVGPQSALSDAMPGVARETGSGFVDLSAEFCGEQGCRFAEEGRLLYIDASHLSAFGSRLAAERLAPAIRASFR